ncbi:MAG: hypothetical protein ABSE82_10830 [Nitrososphaerales archaeon]|jgi:hypothetical protein
MADTSIDRIARQKPFYFKDGEREYTVLAYQSFHEPNDWIVVVREDKYKNDYIRIIAPNAQDAATRAFKMHLDVEEATRRDKQGGYNGTHA